MLLCLIAAYTTPQQDRLVLGARALAAAQHMQLLFVCHSELRAALYGKFACARARHLCIPWRQLPALDLPAAAILALLLGRDWPQAQVQIVEHAEVAVAGTGHGHHSRCCASLQQQQRQRQSLAVATAGGCCAQHGGAAALVCERRAVIDEVSRVRLELEATGSLVPHKQPTAAVAAAAAALQWSAAYAELQRRQDEGLAEAQVYMQLLSLLVPL
jgi:hypothetical protein